MSQSKLTVRQNSLLLLDLKATHMGFIGLYIISFLMQMSKHTSNIRCRPMAFGGLIPKCTNSNNNQWNVSLNQFTKQCPLTNFVKCLNCMKKACKYRTILLCIIFDYTFNCKNAHVRSMLTFKSKLMVIGF